MTTFTTAQNWISRGYSVIPITYRSKRPAFDALRITRCMEGNEISWSMFKERQATNAELKAWFTGPKRNIGVVTGFTGLVVIDFDTLDFYASWCAWAAASGGKALEVMNESYKAISSRGVHVYVSCEEPVESYRVGEVDIKAQWGYVLAPPSIHPSGKEYIAVGEKIVRCERLADVFPLVRPEFIADAEPRVVATDAWEAADNAQECGGAGVVERIHARITVADLLGARLNGRKSVLVRCPLHDDKNPSMLVFADGHCQCLTGCAAGRQLDVIDLYAAINGVSNREAISILGQQ